MSRNLQVILHVIMMALGAIVANDLLSEAGKAYNWPEAHVHLWTKIMLVSQGLGQTIIGTVAQGYNTDGSKPGDRTLTKVVESQPGHMDKEITIETEKLTKKAGEQ